MGDFLGNDLKNVSYIFEAQRSAYNFRTPPHPHTNFCSRPRPAWSNAAFQGNACRNMSAVSHQVEWCCPRPAASLAFVELKKQIYKIYICCFVTTLFGRGGLPYTTPYTTPSAATSHTKTKQMREQQWVWVIINKEEQEAHPKQTAKKQEHTCSHWRPQRKATKRNPNITDDHTPYTINNNGEQ